MVDLSKERLAFDPIYRDAQKVADKILSGVFTKWDGHKDLLRSMIKSYSSKAQRIHFMDAIRKEMLLLMEAHRTKCPKNDNPEACGYEVRYGDAVTIVRGELEVMDPSIASRSLNLSFSRDEADKVVALLNELRDHLRSVEENLMNGQQLTYELISEELDDLPMKLSLGKRDFTSLLIGRVQEVVVNAGIEATVAQPFIDELKKVIGLK